MGIEDLETVQHWIDRATAKLHALEKDIARIDDQLYIGISVSTAKVRTLPEALLRLEAIQQRKVELKRIYDCLTLPHNVLIGKIRRLASALI